VKYVDVLNVQVDLDRWYVCVVRKSMLKVMEYRKLFKVTLLLFATVAKLNSIFRHVITVIMLTILLTRLRKEKL
jgi:hypothetical protein